MDDITEDALHVHTKISRVSHLDAAAVEIDRVDLRRLVCEPAGLKSPFAALMVRIRSEGSTRP